MEAPGFDQEVGGQETCRSQGILREEDFCLSILLGIVTRFMICFFHYMSYTVISEYL